MAVSKKKYGKKSTSKKFAERDAVWQAQRKKAAEIEIVETLGIEAWNGLDRATKRKLIKLHKAGVDIAGDFTKMAQAMAEVAQEKGDFDFDRDIQEVVERMKD